MALGASEPSTVLMWYTGHALTSQAYMQDTLLELEVEVGEGLVGHLLLTLLRRIRWRRRG